MIVDVNRRLGGCVELVARDPNFHDITIGLYSKDQIFTFWTYSRRANTRDRIAQVRDRAVRLTGMEAVPGTHDQSRFTCGDVHRAAIRFVAVEAVERKPDRTIPDGAISTRDNRTKLTFVVTPSLRDDRWTYTVTAEGDCADRERQMRIKAVVGGFVRYGECRRVADDAFMFACGARHDGLARLLVSYARNVTAVEEMLVAQDLAGQMTTQTLGFSQS